MLFRSSIQKVIQAAAVLLRFERTQRMGRLRLVKLLYIADRESLQETGHPILGRRTVAMDHGPLHSEVLDLINGQHVDAPRWSEFFRNDGYHVELRADPGRATLSRYEIGKLTEVSQRLVHREDWDVAEATHAFEEWKKNFQEGSSRTIPFEDIIDAVGRSDDKQSILQDAKDEAAADRLFTG